MIKEVFEFNIPEAHPTGVEHCCSVGNTIGVTFNNKNVGSLSYSDFNLLENSSSNNVGYSKTCGDFIRE
jgi:hypothetical protein